VSELGKAVEPFSANRRSRQPTAQRPKHTAVAASRCQVGQPHSLEDAGRLRTRASRPTGQTLPDTALEGIPSSSQVLGRNLDDRATMLFLCGCSRLVTVWRDGAIVACDTVNVVRRTAGHEPPLATTDFAPPRFSTDFSTQAASQICPASLNPLLHRAFMRTLPSRRTGLPKLTVRVRFPSSAPIQKARSEAVSEAWPFVVHGRNGPSCH
jgi:hypothetical protein